LKITEIAKEAGVSIGTVDRVLHNRGRVSDKTREKIEKIIKENNYRPNQMARNLKIGKKLSIGILIPSLDSEGGYWKAIMDGMEAALEELQSFSVSSTVMEFSRNLKNDMIEKGRALIAEGVDVIALPPVVQEESYQLIKYMENLPYAFFDSPLANTFPITENLQDPYKAGTCGARLMELFQPVDGRFICLQMHDTAYNLQCRAQGFIDYFKDKDVSVLNVRWNGDYKEKFYLFLDKLFYKHPATNGLFVTNDITGIVSKHLSETLKTDMPIIIGFDLVNINPDELEKGNISALISQQPRMQGYNTINEIFRILMMDQKNTIPTSKIPIEIILKENLNN